MPTSSSSRAVTALLLLGAQTQAGGSCGNEGPFVVENALRGQWKMRCANGALAVSIMLAPTTPVKVQLLDVWALKRDEVLGPPAACRP